MKTYEQNMNDQKISEQSVRECAYQIWESEGRPVGQESRHWNMACKLVAGRNNKDSDAPGSSHVLSVIAPEEPSNPDPLTNPEPPNPLPVDPVTPVEVPPHISPMPPVQPGHPADPVQPDNPAKPIQPYTSKRTIAATKSALAEDGVKPAAEKKQTKSRKPKTTKGQDSVII